MINEDACSSTMISTVPCDIEVTTMGRDIQTIINCFSGSETVHPYSDVSLRLIMRMADLLKGNHHCFKMDLDDKEKDIASLTDCLIKEQEQ